MREKYKISAWICENYIFPVWFREMTNFHFQRKFCDIAWKPKFSSECVNAWKQNKKSNILFQEIITVKFKKL